MRVMREAILLLLLVSILNVSLGSFLAETDLGEKREAAVNRQQLDALVEYIVKKVQREQREQESPFYPGSMVYIIHRYKIIVWKLL